METSIKYDLVVKIYHFRLTYQKFDETSPVILSLSKQKKG